MHSVILFQLLSEHFSHQFTPEIIFWCRLNSPLDCCWCFTSRPFCRRPPKRWLLSQKPSFFFPCKLLKTSFSIMRCAYRACVPWRGRFQRLCSYVSSANFLGHLIAKFPNSAGQKKLSGGKRGFRFFFLSISFCCLTPKKKKTLMNCV